MTAMRHAGGPGLDGYIAEARKKLAAGTQPASGPAPAPVAAAH